MKKRVLKNIINYVSDEQIDVSKNSTEIYESSEFSLNLLSPSLIWMELSDDLKFDKVSKHLLENFNDAIEHEDYISAKYMKKEIDNHWEMSEDDFWSLGRDYLVDLKNGCMNSKIYDKYTDTSNELLKIWMSMNESNLLYLDDYGTRTEEYDKFIEKIEDMSDYVNNYFPKEDSKQEILDVITGKDMNHNHPALLIDKIVRYFKLLR